jgi:hypothetical protein
MNKDKPNNLAESIENNITNFLGYEPIDHISDCSVGLNAYLKDMHSRVLHRTKDYKGIVSFLDYEFGQGEYFQYLADCRLTPKMVKDIEDMKYKVIVSYLEEWVTRFPDSKKKLLCLGKEPFSPEDILQEINNKTPLGEELFEVAKIIYNAKDKPSSQYF